MAFTALFDISKREAKDAARLAIQSAAAAAATFLGMQWLSMPEKFVGVLSAVLVVQPTVGNTIGEAMNRLIATIVGSVVGIVCLFLLPGGYGTAVALAISMLAMNAISGIRPEWRYGVVAAVALSLGADNDAFDAAQQRAVAIGGGALLGALTSMIVWPDSATKRARRHLEMALTAASRRLDVAVDDAQGIDGGGSKSARDRYHSNIDSARRAAEGIRHDEGPPLREQIKKTERLYNSALILNRVGEATDDALRSSAEYAKRVKELRNQCCEVAKRLADGDYDVEQQLQSISHAMELVREEASQSSGEAEQHVLENALIFGLGEVELSLRELADAFQAN